MFLIVIVLSVFVVVFVILFVVVASIFNIFVLNSILLFAYILLACILILLFEVITKSLSTLIFEDIELVKVFCVSDLILVLWSELLYKVSLYFLDKLLYKSLLTNFNGKPLTAKLALSGNVAKSIKAEVIAVKPLYTPLLSLIF